MAEKKANSEEEILLAQVESYFERKDYQRQGRCIRFTAVNENAFENIGEDDDLATITLDLSYWQFWQSILGRWLTKEVQEQIEHGLFSEGEKTSWYQLKVLWDVTPAHGYAYSTFSDEEPRYFSLLSCTRTSEPDLAKISSFHLAMGKTAMQLGTNATSVKQFGSGPSWTLWTFHVGQGMCSLLTDNLKHGILLDVGAGTPIVRPDYLRNLIPNDLLSRLHMLESVDLILSHADADHWRLLGWDETLRKKIQNIYLPDNAKSLAFKDRAVIKKVTGIKGLTYQLGGGGSLEVFRSEPAVKRDNTDCLVSIYRSHDQHVVLQSGDYVYKDMMLDKNSSIRSLQRNRYTAIVVPHHGDAESAHQVFAPQKPNQSIAFFSAGNHGYYKHPTAASRDAHKAAQFLGVSNNTLKAIQEVQLAP